MTAYDPSAGQAVCSGEVRLDEKNHSQSFVEVYRRFFWPELALHSLFVRLFQLLAFTPVVAHTVMVAVEANRSIGV